MAPTPAVDLDDLSIYPHADPSGLRQRLRGFSAQCRKAWDEAREFRLPHEYAAVERVVVAGVGGSAIGGDLLADVASLEPSPPIFTVRDYRLPPFVDDKTLVLACSYSGETEETLSAFRDAMARGARVVAVTGGGELANAARAEGVPVFNVDYVGEPRSALGYSFIVPLALVINLGLIGRRDLELDEAMKVLEERAKELAEECPSSGNEAKQLAQCLVDKLVLVYAAGVFMGVARRWKTQINENAKTPAFFESLPELHHNSVVGYGPPGQIKGRTFAVLLQPPGMHSRLGLRYRLTSELLERESVAHRTVQGRGRGILAQMLSTILLGDYTSYYLAVLRGIDPSPVPAIDYLKGRLAEGG